MTKKITAVTLSMLLAAAVAGCGSSSGTAQEAGENSASGEGGTEASSGKTVTIRFAHTNPSGTATVDCIQRFCDEVTEESGGRLVIENYPDSQLGDDDEICDQIYNGAAMMDYVDPAKMEDYYGDYSILVTPYFFENREEILEFARSDLGQELADGCAAAGMKVLDNMGGYYGARQIMSKKEINTPADMKTMKFRVPSTTMWVAMADAWGTNATSVAYSEAYTAITQGVCDAIENPVPSMLASSFQEICPYLNMTSHMYAANGIVMNNNVFESLDEDLQELLVRKAQEFDEWTHEEVAKEEEEAVQTMADQGTIVNDQVDLDAFKEASASIYDTYQGWSEGLVEKCQAELAEIRGNAE